MHELPRFHRLLCVAGAGPNCSGAHGIGGRDGESQRKVCHDGQRALRNDNNKRGYQEVKMATFLQLGDRERREEWGIAAWARLRPSGDGTSLEKAYRADKEGAGRERPHWRREGVKREATKHQPTKGNKDRFEEWHLKGSEQGKCLKYEWTATR
ncbi:hypothetical protein TraAM80_04041 [Trypanosoma rangeli]|uniref:Uncharacterized protein n=1 Tax=Trypanosoma rangeli TaxID=5698 RepID=A0A3R7NGT4_TRYRA|nr:uncharacterized protein TraAM80_04041 [Trypanosoma rangeli]RNF06343.1 hypothetical protein TraAM80_04041 [Trypanosoma rangeli]|eukprot:RNF06343.1 hypothetical protein TraAM80_04041 [Trypanosoma rangeli]